MGRFIKGDIVVVPFPFSDLTTSKKRPALVITKLQGDDLILCLITKVQRNDKYELSLKDSDFKSGGLQHNSFIRPHRLFTADTSIVEKSVGCLSKSKLEEVIKKLKEIISN